MSNRQVFQALTLNGLLGGAATMKVDGSVTPVKKRIIPQEGTLEIARVSICIQAAGSILADNFGPIAGLATGLLFGKYLQVSDASTVDLLGGETIKTNGDFARCGFDLTIRDFGSGDDYIVAEYLFERKCGGPLIVNNDEYFGLVIQDDLTGITEGRAQIAGLYIG